MKPRLFTLVFVIIPVRVRLKAKRALETVAERLGAWRELVEDFRLRAFRSFAARVVFAFAVDVKEFGLGEELTLEDLARRTILQLIIFRCKQCHVQPKFPNVDL